MSVQPPILYQLLLSLFLLSAWLGVPKPVQGQVPGTAVINVKAHGATGDTTQLATGAVQKALEACGANGGGTVYFPPGAYTIGSVRLTSNTTVYVEAGATLFASRDSTHYSIHLADHRNIKVLLYGEDLRNLTIAGKGTIDGVKGY